MANLHTLFRRAHLIQNSRTTYSELVQALFGETPPENHDFLSRVNPADVAEIIKSRAYNMGAFAGNPNPAAKIGFLIHYPFQYYIYKNIYRHLPDSEFIINAVPMRGRVADWGAFFNTFIPFLERERARFRIYRNTEDAEGFFAPYEVLVSNIWIHPLDMECNRNKKKVRVMYGQAKDMWAHGPWSRHFDLALTFGPHSHEAISKFTKSVPMGNPRFDDWFLRGATAQEPDALRANLGLNQTRKTVLYIPTHSDLGSPEYMTEAVRRLSKTYNLVIKLHPITLYWETERLKSFKNSLGDIPGLAWADDTVDLPCLLRLADVVITENSGAMFDAVLMDRPLVLLDQFPEGVLEKKIERYVGSDPTTQKPLTHPSSMEERVKHEKELSIGEVATRAEELPRTVSAAILKEHDFSAGRDKIKKMLFSFCDGSSGQRAADAINDLAGGERPPKNILATQIDLEVTSEKIYRQRREAALRRASQAYINLSSGLFDGELAATPLFSVIIPTFNRAGALINSMQNLASQRGVDKIDFEIIAVDDGSGDDTPKRVAEFMAHHPEQLITYIRLSKNHGPAYARNVGVLNARGDLCAFGDDDTLIPEDWLLQFRKAFENNPEIAGVGGEFIPGADIIKRRGFWDSYFYGSFSQKFHIPRFFKTATPAQNKAGITGNICYKKTVIKDVGGFNAYFRFACHEDQELKLRVLGKKYSLLDSPSAVTHVKGFTLKTFARHLLLRGWALMLIRRIHPSAGPGGSLAGYLFSATRDLPNLFRRRRVKFNNLRFSYFFVIVHFFHYLLLWSGKYIIPLFYWENQNDES